MNLCKLPATCKTRRFLTGRSTHPGPHLLASPPGSPSASYSATCSFLKAVPSSRSSTVCSTGMSHTLQLWVAASQIYNSSPPQKMASPRDHLSLGRPTVILTVMTLPNNAISPIAHMKHRVATECPLPAIAFSFLPLYRLIQSLFVSSERAFLTQLSETGLPSSQT